MDQAIKGLRQDWYSSLGNGFRDKMIKEGIYSYALKKGRALLALSDEEGILFELVGPGGRKPIGPAGRDTLKEPFYKGGGTQ